MKSGRIKRVIGLESDDAAQQVGRQNKSAPKISVKGEALLAEKIVAVAKRYGIPVVENGALVESLSSVMLDEEIPPELYAAVATLLLALGQE